MKKQVKLSEQITFGDGKIYVQSMLNVRAEDIAGNVKQAIDLEEAGCQIVRVAIPDKQALALIPAIKEKITIPLVADIHFDYKLALESVSAGIDKIRINPGNIGDSDRVKAVVDACSVSNVPIRIGVNSGSLEKDILKKYGGVTSAAMVESALYHVKLLEKFDFDNIVISIKSSNVKDMVIAYRDIITKCDYPMHLGVTEAGTYKMGVIKSAVGIGSLLVDGIGDTIRVSLTDDPVKEVECAYDILTSLGLNTHKKRVNLISCPTCGRTKIDLIGLAKRVEEHLRLVEKDITVAVMGCVVNGPGEAVGADIGIAGGDGCAVLFKKGIVIRKIREEDILSELISEIEQMD